MKKQIRAINVKAIINMKDSNHFLTEIMQLIVTLFIFFITCPTLNLTHIP